MVEALREGESRRGKAKDFFTSHIELILDRGVLPTRSVFDDGYGNTFEVYVFGHLPYGRVLVYMHARLEVVRGIKSLELEGVTYKANTIKRLLGDSSLSRERALVMKARALIRAYKRSV